jgi:hypothetical protein
LTIAIGLAAARLKNEIKEIFGYFLAKSSEKNFFFVQAAIFIIKT